MSESICSCEACIRERALETIGTRMIVCETCGNKRCPHATNHIHPCTGDNSPGQFGSSWENVRHERNS